jgi:hypothetical protein
MEASQRGFCSAIPVTSLSRTSGTPSPHRALTWTYVLALDQLDARRRFLRHVPGRASEGPRMRTGASSGPSKRYWRAGVFVSFTAPR